MTDWYHLSLNIILSLAETLILFQMYRAFLRHSYISYKYYYTGLASYFMFQFLTYTFHWPLFSACIYYLIFTLLLACIFFSDTFQVKILVTYLFVLLHYSCKLACTTIFMVLDHVNIPEIPSSLVQAPVSQIAACIMFVLLIRLFIYFRNMRKHNNYALYSPITYIAPAGILAIVIHQFYVRVFQVMASFYLNASGILLFTSFALFYLIDKTEMIGEASHRSMMVI